MKFVFRTDASSKIGTGHMMRCLTLAKKLRDIGKDCKFICRDNGGNFIEKILQEKFDVISLNSSIQKKMNRAKNFYEPDHYDWLGVNWEEDAQQTINALGKDIIDWLVIDHYALNNQWEKTLRPYTKKIMVIDDLGDRKHECDLLLDQNLGSSEERYKKLIPQKCKRLFGPKFALLNPIYSSSRAKMKNRKGDIKRVLIYFGWGKETIKILENVINLFSEPELKNIYIDIVVSSDHSDFVKIKKKIAGRNKLNIYSNLTNLVDLMKSSDLSIGAGGSTTWERCCMGLPSIIVETALNQKLAAEAMKSEGAAFVFKPSTNLINEIRDAVLLLKKDLNVYLEMSNKAFKICDGNGINRVVEFLLNNKE